MFIDARTVSEQDIISADICIIGAGPAGLSVAMELFGSEVSVCLLESGDIDFHQDTQSLYRIGYRKGWKNFKLFNHLLKQHLKREMK